MVVFDRQRLRLSKLGKLMIYQPMAKHPNYAERYSLPSRNKLLSRIDAVAARRQAGNNP